MDALPATYRYYKAPRKRVVGNPADDIPAFVRGELSLGALADILKHPWFTSAKRPATPLHFHISIGGDIAVADRMDLYTTPSSQRGKALRQVRPALSSQSDLLRKKPAVSYWLHIPQFPRRYVPGSPVEIRLGLSLYVRFRIYCVNNTLYWVVDL